jgi:DNA-binding sugar fermentation-stimulating protein
MENNILLTIDNLIEGEIQHRPSKLIKSPYVADIKCWHDGADVIGHTASLGCCGLVERNAHVLISVSPEPKTKTKPKNAAGIKCTHTVYLSILHERGHEQIIGVHPKLAEKIVENALTSNLISKLQNIKKFRRETSIHIKDLVDSRFDFTGVDCNNIPFIMEVKNVPLADYEDVSAKERKNMNFDDRDVNSKVAYFPDGYRKKTSDPVSPRALKHIKELTLIKQGSSTRCITCYVIQRTDVNRFQPSVIDPEYREAVKNAIDAGVEIITLVVSWNRQGQCTFIRDDLPITQF